MKDSVCCLISSFHRVLVDLSSLRTPISCVEINTVLLSRLTRPEASSRSSIIVPQQCLTILWAVYPLLVHASVQPIMYVILILPIARHTSSKMLSHTRTRRMALSSVLATVLVFILAILGSRHQVLSPDLQAKSQILPAADFRQSLPSLTTYHTKVPVVFGRNVNVITRQATGDPVPEWLELPDSEKLRLHALDITKGGSYLCELRASTEEADKLLSERTKGLITNSQSLWTEYSDLEKWGWRVPTAFAPLGDGLLDDVYEELGLDDSNNKPLSIRQLRDINIGGKNYPVSTISLVSHSSSDSASSPFC